MAQLAGSTGSPAEQPAASPQINKKYDAAISALAATVMIGLDFCVDRCENIRKPGTKQRFRRAVCTAFTGLGRSGGAAPGPHRIFVCHF